jgi:hypothetical protein
LTSFNNNRPYCLFFQLDILNSFHLLLIIFIIFNNLLAFPCSYVFNHAVACISPPVNSIVVSHCIFRLFFLKMILRRIFSFLLLFLAGYIFFLYWNDFIQSVKEFIFFKLVTRFFLIRRNKLLISFIL